MPNITPEQIDAVLPQTQCGLCNYGGCMPYAEAIAYENAPINLCPPGGVNTLQTLSQLTGQDAIPYVEEMTQKAKPKMLAVIREAECIGCTKCIQACPVDAIVGSAKQMHSVVASECSGCELCVAPCPVDCIDMVELPDNITQQESQQFRERYNARTQRLAKTEEEKQIKKVDLSIIKRKNYIEEALARSRLKKT